MTDVAWICAAIICVLLVGVMIWVSRAFTQAAQKEQAQAQASIVAGISRQAVTVERAMAEAQTAAPGDDAALQQRLKDGTF